MVSPSSKANLFKSLHGQEAKQQVRLVLESMRNAGLLEGFRGPVRYRHPSRPEDQFYFQFEVQFSDGERWLLQSTTSIRDDRANIYQWHALFIKHLYPEVRLALIVLPDEISATEKVNMERYREKVVAERIYSALDDVVFLSEVYSMIERRALAGESLGYTKAKLGTELERRLVAILNSKSNLDKWNSRDPVLVGLQYPVFKAILRSCGVPGDAIIDSLQASNDIPPLDSGGSPKADVCFDLAYEGKNESFSISSKRSSARRVTVHEYSAATFVDALGIEDRSVIRALEAFQNEGAVTKISESTAEVITAWMSAHVDELLTWVISGACSTMPQCDSRCADLVATYDDESNDFSVYPVEAYIKMLKRTTGQFGTPFSWTYPSGGKGKRIQLKAAVM